MTAYRRARPGQSIVLLAFVGTVLIMMVGLVVDAGFSYVVRRRIQNVADAASRAGANYLAQSYSDAQIQAVVTSVGNNNNCSSGGTLSCTWTASYIDTSGAVVGTVGSGSIPSTAAGVKVVPQTTYSSFLATLVGRNTFTVSATASAIYGPLGATRCGSMLPAAVNGNTGTGFADWSINACVLIRDDEGAPSGGSFGWVDLTGGGGGIAALTGWMNNYASSGNTGCTNMITVGTATTNVETGAGNRAALQSALLNIIQSASYNHITVPIYDTYGTDSDCSNSSTSGGSFCYRVKGFGRFRITDVKLSTLAPHPETTPCNQALFGTTIGILGQFVGFVDPNGSINASATGPAKAANIIH